MAVELLCIERPVGNKKASSLMKEINAFSEYVIEDAQEFYNVTIKEMKEMEGIAKGKGKRAIVIFAAAIGMSVLSLPLLFLYMSRYVTRPILTLHEGAGARLIKDVDSEDDLPKEDILSPDIQSIIAVPFGRRDKILGLLCAFKDRPKMFEWHDLRFFREHLKVELERTDRYNHTLSLIILDIDHFKHYNDTHGHPQGDELLRGLAELLRKSVRESDIPCRYGGEEFALILPETTKDAALALGERIRKAVSEHPFPFRETQPMGTLSVSVGVAASPADGKEINGLIKKADDALYNAKSEGRNKVVGA